MNSLNLNSVDEVLCTNQAIQNLTFVRLNNKINLVTKIFFYIQGQDLKSVFSVCKSWKLIDSKTKPIVCEKFYEFYDSRSVSESDESFSKSPWNEDIFIFDS